MATKQGFHYGGKKIKTEAYTGLRELRALPLKEKIQRSMYVISCWYEAWDGKVVVSYSGGKDSSVLMWLVRQLFPDVPGVFCNTGLEYPEVVTHVKKTPNVEIVRPSKPFHHVIKDHGWPLISKRVSRGISILRNPTGANDNIWKLYNEGVNRFGEAVQGFKTPSRWRFLIDAPFECSDICCKIMKKDPMHKYQKKTGRMPYLGLLATDSKAREKAYLQHSCNAYDIANPRSLPLGFWTEQDILECIAKNDIKIPRVYGKIVGSKRNASTTGVHRTGCMFCGFGLHLDTIPTRFQRLSVTHPRQYKYIMDRLGMQEVMEYCRKHACGTVANRFSTSHPARILREREASLLEVV